MYMCTPMSFIVSAPDPDAAIGSLPAVCLLGRQYGSGEGWRRAGGGVLGDWHG